jgi:uncharacterized protein (DUF1786 family)
MVEVMLLRVGVSKIAILVIDAIKYDVSIFRNGITVEACLFCFIDFASFLDICDIIRIAIIVEDHGFVGGMCARVYYFKLISIYD